MLSRRDFLKLFSLFPLLYTDKLFEKEQTFYFETNGNVALADTSPQNTLHVVKDVQFPIEFPLSFSDSTKQSLPNPIIKNPIKRPQPQKPDFIGHFLPERTK